MSTIAELNIDITGSTAGLESSMNQAAGIVERAGDRMMSAGKAVSAGVSAPLGLIGGLAINAANDLNENLGNVQSLGVAQEQVESYKESIQDLSITVAKDTDDLGDGLYQVVSAFGDGADTVAILETNAKAAAAGLASTTDAINLTSAVTKGYGDTSKEAVQGVADLAFKTVQLGQTTFPELASSMGRVVPLGAAMGVSMEELFGVMATGTGVTGSAAEVSTQLRGVLQSMAAPTAQMSTLIEKWGFNSGEAALESMGLQGVISGITEEAQASGLPLQKYISSIEGQTLALALAGPQADVFTEKLSAMESASGAMDEAFTAQTEGINANGFAMAQARQKLNVFLQDIGAGLAPILSVAIDLLEPLVDKITGWADAFANLEPQLQLIIGGIGVFLVMLGPALLIAGQLAGAISALTPVFAALGSVIGVILSPLGLLIAGIGALLYFDIGGLRTMIVELGTAVYDFGVMIVGAWPDIMNLVGAFREAGPYSSEFNQALGLLPEALQAPAQTMGNLVSAAGDLWDALKWIWEGEGAEVDWWWDITGAIAEAFGIPQETGEAWASSLYDMGVKVSDTIEGMRAAWDLLVMAFSGEMSIEGLMDASAALEAAFGPTITNAIWSASFALAAIWGGIQALAGSEELANFVTVFTENMTAIGKAIAGVFSGDVSLGELATTITTALTEMGASIKAILEGEAFTAIKDGFAKLFDAVGILEPLQNLGTNIESIVTELEPYLEGPLARLVDAFSGLSGIDFTPITDGMSSIKDAFDSIFSDEDGTGAGFDLVAALGVGALQLAIESAALIVENGIATFQAMIETVGNIMTLFGEVVEGAQTVIDGALNGDMDAVITGVKEIITAFVTFLTDQVAVIKDLGAQILENIETFVGATFEDIGILFNEPEWLSGLLTLVDDMGTPQWVTDIMTWEWEMPDWVSEYFPPTFTKPGWLDSFISIIDKLLSWSPGGIFGFQSGTAYAPGGMAWVGERGPELMHVPRGSRIFDARASREMAASVGGGDIIVQQMIVRDQSDIWRLAEELDALKRRRG